MHIIKLGGSLMDNPALAEWPRALAGQSSDWVVVPGGGAFADQVRHAQQRWRFDDATAHTMALLAMEQFGWLLTGLHPALCPAYNRKAISASLAAGQVPVWMPSAMMRDDPAIAHDWTTTSDSLAAWLAREIAAEELLLVKSAPLEPGTADVEALKAAGVVDDAFGGMIAGDRFRVRIIHAEHYQHIANNNSYTGVSESR